MRLLPHACYGGGVVQLGGADEPRPIKRGLAMATAAPVQPAAPRRGFKGLLARHPLVSYFLIAFTFSWLLFLPGPLTYLGVLHLNPSTFGMLAIAGLLGPILSGFIMTALIEGRAWATCCGGWCCGESGFSGTCSPSSASPWSCCWARSSDPGPWGRSISPPSRSPWPTLSPSSPWSQSGTAVRGTGVDRFRATPLAAAARATGRGPHPG